MSDDSLPRMDAWRTPALRVELVAVPARERLRGHGHDEPHLCHVLGGAFDERERHLRHRTVAAGTLRASPAGDEHDLVFRAPTQCLLVLFEAGALDVDAPSLHERRFHASERASRLADAMRQALLRDRDFSPLELEALALELLAAGLSVRDGRPSEPPRWLVRMRERIRDEPARAPTTTELAAEAGLHPVYLARAFRRHFGIGIGEYARVVRAERARRALALGDAPLAQVAASAGYADQSHLTRELRRLLRATPGQVRRGGGRILEVAAVQDPRAFAV